MKRTVLAFALPVLLALSPVRAPAASILWVSVDPDKPVYNLQGELLESALRNFRLDGRGVNAAKVSVSDGVGGTTSYLVIAYEESGRMVTDDPTSDTVELSFSGSGDPGTSGGTGGTGDTQSAGQWIPVYLADLENRDLTVTLELGNVDWAAYDDYVENNADTPGASLAIDDRFFHGLAYATATLGELMDAPYVTQQNNLNPPSSSPWTPKDFTAVPEPSVCLTALLGVILLSRRRRPRQAAR